MEIITELKNFIDSELAVDSDLDKQSLSIDEDLITAGIVDSMGILKLVAFIEKKFSIKLTDDDIIPDNFRNLNSLEQLVKNKQKI